VPAERPVTPIELRRYYRIGLGAYYKLIKEGLPTVWVGKRRRFFLSEVAAFLGHRRRPTWQDPGVSRSSDDAAICINTTSPSSSQTEGFVDAEEASTRLTKPKLSA
jgi:hypothetical protein